VTVTPIGRLIYLPVTKEDGYNLSSVPRLPWSVLIETTSIALDSLALAFDKKDDRSSNYRYNTRRLVAARGRNPRNLATRGLRDFKSSCADKQEKLR
jgi:hypothetical protein